MEVKEIKITKKEDTRALTVAKEYRVIKANELIQRTRYTLSTQEQHIIAYLVSKIKPEDDEFHLYEFKIKDFCQACNIDETNGKNYISLKASLKKLADKSIWITLPDGRETLLRWIERPIIDKRSGTVQIKLDELMKPYLLQLKDRFTQYELYYNLVMKSKYSIRLYELLKSYSNLSQWTFDIDDLKKKLDAENYKRYPDFKRYVLDIALKEINNISDLAVTMEVIKESHRYAKIKFLMHTKNCKNRQETDQAIENKDKLSVLASTKPVQIEQAGQESEEEIEYEVKKEILNTRKLPYEYKSDERRMTAAIHFITEWDTFKNGYRDELEQRVYLLFVEALIEMCCADKPMTLKGSYVTYKKVIDKINQLAKVTDTYVDISEFSEVAMNNFKEAMIDKEIKNPLQYMKSCIWDAMQTGNIELYADLAKNNF